MSLKEALLIALHAGARPLAAFDTDHARPDNRVSAVILLPACGQGDKNSVDARIETVSNNITIVPKTADVPRAPAAQPLTEEDAGALLGAPDIATVTPAVSSSTGSTTVQTNTAQFLSGRASHAQAKIASEGPSQLC